VTSLVHEHHWHDWHDPRKFYARVSMTRATLQRTLCFVAFALGSPSCGSTDSDPQNGAATSRAPPLKANGDKADASGNPTVQPDAGASTSPGDAVADSGIADSQGDAKGPSSIPGACCSSGDCLCHGPVPTALTSENGPFNASTFELSTGRVFYPIDATPPFAVVAIAGGFTNTGPEMDPWGAFYASYAIVTIVTTTLGTDQPAERSSKLLAAIKDLKANTTGPLVGKLSYRFGTSGYSMGGGGATIASKIDPTLKTTVGLAPFAPANEGMTVPTLLLCGTADIVAPCSQTQRAYAGIADSIPKMAITIDGATHFSWFSPTSAGMGVSAKYTLAFQKVYLEGDERWAGLLKGRPANGKVTTNIQ
jgi:pimeloyl-ACP methyl ester carboxylesterase